MILGKHSIVLMLQPITLLPTNEIIALVLTSLLTFDWLKEVCKVKIPITPVYDCAPESWEK